MRCRHHPEQPAVQACAVCHEQVCADCLLLGQQIRCLRCAQKLLDKADGRKEQPVAAAPKPKKRGAGMILALFGAIIAIGLAAPLAPYLCRGNGDSPYRTVSAFIRSLAEGDLKAASGWLSTEHWQEADLSGLRSRLRLDGEELRRAALADLKRVTNDGRATAIATVIFRGEGTEQAFLFHLVHTQRGWRLAEVAETSAESCRSRQCCF